MGQAGPRLLGYCEMGYLETATVGFSVSLSQVYVACVMFTFEM